MRNLFFLVIILFSTALVSCIGKDAFIYGYVPETETTKVEWTNENGNFFATTSILVITEGGNSIKAIYSAQGHFFGSNGIIYRDSYPPSKGKKVYVKIRKQEESFYLVEASLIPFEK